MKIIEHFYDRTISCGLSEDTQYLFHGLTKKYISNRFLNTTVEVKAPIKGSTAQTFSSDNKLIAITTSYDKIFVVDVECGDTLFRHKFDAQGNPISPIIKDDYVYWVECNEIGVYIHRADTVTYTVETNYFVLPLKNCRFAAVSDFLCSGNKIICIISCDRYKDNSEDTRDPFTIVLECDLSTRTKKILAELSTNDCGSIKYRECSNSLIAWNIIKDCTVISDIELNGDIIQTIKIPVASPFGALCNQGRYIVLGKGFLGGLFCVDLEKQTYIEYPSIFGLISKMNADSFFSIEKSNYIALYEIIEDEGQEDGQSEK